MARWLILGCILCTVCCLVGCSSKPQPVAVTGTVELDGQPLDDGSITLFPDGGGAAEKFTVKNGKFEGQALPGKKKVEIHAFKQGEPTKMGDKIIPAPLVNYIPAKYNTESKI